MLLGGALRAEAQQGSFVPPPQTATYNQSGAVLGVPLKPASQSGYDAGSSIKGERFAATARDAEGDERERLWKQMNRVWRHYDEYQTRTERRIPVVVLERERS